MGGICDAEWGELEVVRRMGVGGRRRRMCKEETFLSSDDGIRSGSTMFGARFGVDV